MTRTPRRWPVFIAQVLLTLYLALAVFLDGNFCAQHTILLPDVSIRIDQVIFVLLGFIGAFCLFFLDPPLDRRISLWFLILAPIWFLGAFQSETRVFALNSIVGFIVRGFIPAFIISAVVRSPGGLRFLIRLVILMAVLISFVGLMQWIFSQNVHFSSWVSSDRISSTIGHPIPMAAFLLAAWPLTAECLAPAWQLSIGAGIAMCVIGSQSRGEMTIGVLMVLLYLKLRPSSKALIGRVMQAAVLGLALIIGFLFFTHRQAVKSWTQVAGKRWSLATLNTDLFHSHRAASYRTTARMLKARFWLGGGLGTFPLRFNHFKAEGSVDYVYSPDNLYLRILADTGVIGLTAFLILLFFSFKSIQSAIVRFPETANVRKALLISFISLLLAGILFDSLFWPPILLLFELIAVAAATRWESGYGPL